MDADPTSLLGHQVVVTLSYNPKEIARGRLLAWNDGGEVAVEDDNGFV